MEVGNTRRSRHAFVLKFGLLSIAALFVARTCPLRAATGPVSNLASLHALTNPEAAKAFPVRFEATVTYYRDYDIDLFVQDGLDAIYVRFQSGATLRPGDRVLITGRTQESFRPIVVADSVVVLHHGKLPIPATVNYDQLFNASLDCRLVTVRGTVRSAAMVWSARRRNIYMQVLTGEGLIDVAVNSDDGSVLSHLLDADVELTGVMASKFDEKLQQTGTSIDIQSLDGVKVLSNSGTRPDSLPVTPTENVLGGYRVRDFSKRLQVEGIVTYDQPGVAVVLQNGSKSISVMTLSDTPVNIGDRAFASGFPDVRNGYLGLNFGEVRDTHLLEPIIPAPVSWKQVQSGTHAFELVAVEGRLLMQARETAKDEYVLDSDSQLFSAILRHPLSVTPADLPPMKLLPIGSRIRVTGVTMFYSTDPFSGPEASDLLLRTSNDVVVIAPPSRLTIRNLLLTVAALLIVVLLFAARGWILEHRFRRQTARFAAQSESQAEIERRRSRILENINGDGPITGILEQIAALVSFRLEGTPTWIESKDGACLVPRPRDLRVLHIERHEMLNGSGNRLGSIVVGLDPAVRSPINHQESLSMGAHLATLAIESRKLYADLVQRSEMDQLTGAHNRFSLEKHLDLMVESASAQHTRFGVVYLDLDRFKQVNDLFGHRIGDLYLEQVAARLQSQLRAHDILARVGGDEFAALVSDVNTGTEVHEVIQRLQSSLDEPLLIEGHPLQAAASFGFAIFPEDGVTNDSLLSAADCTMYRAKNLKRSAAKATTSNLH